jgi:hypothetical protein
MIRSMKGFTFASALELNMGYFHILLDADADADADTDADADADAQKLCTIVSPWYMGKYKYKRLSMGIKIAWFLTFFKISCLSS